MHVKPNFITISLLEISTSDLLSTSYSIESSIRLFTRKLDFLVRAFSTGPIVVVGEVPPIPIEGSEIIVVLVVSSFLSIFLGPRRFASVAVAKFSGFLVLFLPSKQFVFFLNFPTLLFEPRESVIINLVLYLESSGTFEIVVIDLNSPAEIIYLLSATLLLSTKTLTVSSAATLEFTLFTDKP